MVIYSSYASCPLCTHQLLFAGTTVTEIMYTTLLALLTTGALFAAAVSSGFNATWPIYAFGASRAHSCPSFLAWRGWQP